MAAVVTFDPELLPLAGLGVLAVLYAQGSAASDPRRGRSARRRRLETAAFAGGVLVAAAALSPPVDGRADQGYAAHMVQHLLLAVVAAPLLALGAPGRRLALALPHRLVFRFGRQFHRHRRPLRLVTAPLTTWAIFLVVLWAWHAPALYDAALRHSAVHATEHATLLLAGYVYAASLLESVRRQRAYGGAIISLTTTSLHCGALGALLLFSAAPLSHVYAARRGAGALADQQLAGVYMWVVAGPLFVIVAVALLALAIADSERHPGDVEVITSHRRPTALAPDLPAEEPSTILQSASEAR